MSITVAGTKKVSNGASLYRGQSKRVAEIPCLGDAGYLDYVDRLGINPTSSYVTAKDKIKQLKTAIEKIMSDVESENISSKSQWKKIKDFPYLKSGDYWRVLCLRFNQYVSDYGMQYGDQPDIISADTLHYFRNKLNRYPDTLDELVDLQKKGEADWELYRVGMSVYHMLRTPFSDTGLKNLKFVCQDSIFEAVYNHNKKPCSEEDDPKNMGTYNYGSLISHYTNDVQPYYKYGNTKNDTYEGSPDSGERYHYFRDHELEVTIPGYAEEYGMGPVDMKLYKESEQADIYRTNFVKKWVEAGGRKSTLD